MSALNTRPVLKKTDPRLSLSHALSYSAPYMAMVWLGAPIPILQGIYAKYYGFSLTTLASIVLLARFFDAVTDPLIGYYSDRYYQRTGSRKPFIFLGGLLLVVSAYFLYIPTGDASGNVSIVYFTIWFLAIYLAMTLFEVPHSAWASELALTSADKTKIFSFRSIAGLLGMVCFYVIPLLPIFETQDITPETLEFSVMSAAILMLIFLYFCLKKTPNPSLNDSIDVAATSNNEDGLKKNSSLVHLYHSIAGNKPLLIFFGAFLAYGFAVGMWYSLIFLYVDSYLDLGEYFAQAFLLSYIVSIIATPLWCRLAIAFGKKNILSAAMILLIVSYIGATLLVPGVSGLWELIALQIISTLGGGCMITFAPAMLSEIIDYSTLKYRTENTATYYALFMFLGKFNLAVGGALALAIAGLYGLNPTSTVQTQEGIEGLLIAIAWLPMVFASIALVLIYLSPINARQHHIIRRSLDIRIAREN